MHETTSWSKALLFTWLFFGLMYFDIPSKIEGSLWSVIDTFEITKVESVKGGIEIYGNFYKRRNCFFNDLHAYVMNERGFYTEVEIIQYDRGAIREVGRHSFGPWFIQVASEDFKKVTIFSHHTCHSLWQTESRVVPR